MILKLTQQEALQELKALKRSNKQAREVRATKRGFKSFVDYMKALQDLVDGKVVNDNTTSSIPTKKKNTSKSSSKKPTIIIIDVLDRSGSMGSLASSNSKITNAVRGINSGVEKLKEDESILGVEYKHVFICFDTEICVSNLESIKNVGYLSVDGRGGTALNDTIMSAISMAMKHKKDEDKVLINIYTDGGENASKEFTYADVKKEISIVEKLGVTVTFIGTKYDTNYAIRNYGLHDSNTAVYDGTAKGLESMMQLTNSARAEYSTKVLNNEDVSRGFYKKIIKKS